MLQTDNEVMLGETGKEGTLGKVYGLAHKFLPSAIGLFNNSCWLNAQRPPPSLYMESTVPTMLSVSLQTLFLRDSCAFLRSW